MKTLALALLIGLAATYTHAETLAEVLNGVSSRCAAVLDQQEEVGSAVNVTHGDHVGKTMRTYDWPVMVVQANGTQTKTTQRIYVYDKDGDNETAVLGGAIVADYVESEETDPLERGKVLIRDVIANQVDIPAALLSLAGTNTYKITDYLGLPDIKVAGQDVSRIKLWLSDSTVIIRSPQFAEKTAENPLGIEFWKVAE